VVVSTLQQGNSSSSGLATWEPEYGLYAQLLAQGSSAAGTAPDTANLKVGSTTGAAAAEAGSRTASQGSTIGGDGSAGRAVAVGHGVEGVRVSFGPVVKASGYSAGSMRELSLVALGADGVTVQRLEAYEMASMWDDAHDIGV
jgi:hypothetical protein